MLSIEYDTTLNKKKVLLKVDTPFIWSGTQAVDDLPQTHVPINYYWKWRAFYWFKNGNVMIK
jgi:hypothetical protein